MVLIYELSLKIYMQLLNCYLEGLRVRPSISLHSLEALDIYSKDVV